uniref:Multiple resistance and pH regulation protein F n=1 Tax=uncultured microorganism TaxID=358574 RepID=F8UHA0_9ZZZZ|nr:multiple resistance and pH regulation protein F [uncultured microorganism]
MSPLLLGAANLAIGILAVALLLCLARLVRGPSVLDRILALDTLYVDTIALLVVVGIRFAEPAFFDGALVIALLGFVGTVALAKYQLRGDIVD